MNTARSSALGWGSLVLAAGVSYMWARKGIDERRKEQEAAGTRSTEKLDWRARIERDATTHSATSPTSEVGKPPSIDNISSDGSGAPSSTKTASS
ncbi:hypothetical protein BXZ70DRAFT_1006235 [Cristinia sonorae]|uniref:Uncharacterized protein n=1 Tax=Cristinia sonorae TaxID=1940300 RepID=A0A8K0UTJ5_9AGAR|nr:hypothetical protein BXZ70DRAFT_1006235 [Cristinia sonorae]